MGQPVSSVLQKLVSSPPTDKPDKESELRDLLTSIQRQTENELDTFYNNVVKSNKNNSHKLPISTVLHKFYKLEIITETDEQTKIVTAIENIVKQATSSSVSGVVSALMGTAVQALFGTKSLEYSTQEGYCISLGLLGGVERLDFKFSRFAFNATSWFDKNQTVMSMIIITSACDLDAINQNECKVIVQSCFSALSAADAVNDQVEEQDSSQKSKQDLVGSIQFNMAQLLSLQIENNSKDSDLDEALKTEENLILTVNDLYRELIGLNAPEAIQKAQRELEDLKKHTMDRMLGKRI